MTVTIRHAEPEDAGGVHRILAQDHVLDGTMRLPFQDLGYMKERLTPTRAVIQLVSVESDDMLGFSELITHPDIPRHRHAGEINMIVTDVKRSGPRNWSGIDAGHGRHERYMAADQTSGPCRLHQ